RGPRSRRLGGRRAGLLPRLGGGSHCRRAGAGAQPTMALGAWLLALERLTRRRTREPRLKPQNRLRVQLGDPRFGHPEYLADLAQGQLLVVVERDDELFPLGQA